jgi:hypothetical protein
MIVLSDKCDYNIEVYYDKANEKILFNNKDNGITDELPLNGRAYRKYNDPYTFGLRPNETTTINGLMNLNFDHVDYTHDYDTNNSIYIVNFFREYLFNQRLINKYDKEYLDSIGFNYDDYMVKIEDLSLCVRDIKKLNRRNFMYLWQLLVFPHDMLKFINNIGPESYSNIISAIRMTGYTMKGMEKAVLKGPVDNQSFNTSENKDNSYMSFTYDEGMNIINHIHKVIDSNKVYISEIEDIKKKVKQSNDELYELEKMIKRNIKK